MKKSIYSYLVVVLLLPLIFSACQPSKSTNPSSPRSVAEVRYAKGFSIAYHNGYTEVVVRNPWDTVSILQRYLLVGKNAALPSGLPQGTVVRTPVQRTVCTSGIQVTMLDMLGLFANVVAVSDGKHMPIEQVQQGITNGNIVDLGDPFVVDVERLMLSAPDIIISAPYQNAGHGALTKAGAPIADCADYMENTPLGRAEWIKFVAVFYGKEQEAARLFDGIAERYNATVEQVKVTKRRPTVFSELKTGQVWYVPGGQSYMSAFFRDAGADYLWANDEESGSLALSFEAVYERAQNADFWFIKYFDKDKDKTYADLTAEYRPYVFFKAHEQHSIYGCNTGRCNYYEQGSVNPDVILRDMAKIFHPGLFSGHEPVYFKPLAE